MSSMPTLKDRIQQIRSKAKSRVDEIRNKVKSRTTEIRNKVKSRIGTSSQTQSIFPILPKVRERLRGMGGTSTEPIIVHAPPVTQAAVAIPAGVESSVTQPQRRSIVSLLR